MREVIGFLAIVMACSACVHDADDCRNTRTCDPPPDAGVTVVYVTSDAGLCDGVCAPLPPAGTDWSPQPFIGWFGFTTALPDSDKRCPSKTPVTRAPIRLKKREINRQGAKNAKKTEIFFSDLGDLGALAVKPPLFVEGSTRSVL